MSTIKTQNKLTLRFQGKDPEEVKRILEEEGIYVVKNVLAWGLEVETDEQQGCYAPSAPINYQQPKREVNLKLDWNKKVYQVQLKPEHPFAVAC